MLLQKERAVRVHKHKMKRFFKAADSSQDGCVDKDEFLSILDKPQVRTWLAAQELNCKDGEKLYMLLNKGKTMTVNLGSPSWDLSLSPIVVFPASKCSISVD
jgi:hypothetical protein